MSETTTPSRLQLEKPFPKVPLRTPPLSTPAHGETILQGFSKELVPPHSSTDWSPDVTALHVCQPGSDVQHLNPAAEEATLVVCPYAKGIKQC